MQQVHRYLELPMHLFCDPVSDLKALLDKHDYSFDPLELQHYRFPLTELSAAFASWFENEYPDLFIKDWEVFYTPAGRKLPVHSDGFQPFLDFIKFNFVYDGDGSVMSWYRLKGAGALDVGTTRVDTSYTAIEEEQAERIFSCVIDKPSLVNAGVPHGVDNSENEKGRWCVSLIPCYRGEGKHNTTRILFDDAEQIFSDCILRDI